MNVFNLSKIVLNIVDKNKYTQTIILIGPC